jgi:hypothetical protein
VPAEEGSLNDLSGILTYILKKNRYCLQYIDDGETKTFHAIFNINDLKWYLPAYEQFANFVANPEVEGDSRDDYWSSTAADGATYAYRGNGVLESRDTLLRVIAVRKNEYNISPATIDEINTEEMAGGENGEAQWVE